MRDLVRHIPLFDAELGSTQQSSCINSEYSSIQMQHCIVRQMDMAFGKYMNSFLCMHNFTFQSDLTYVKLC